MFLLYDITVYLIYRPPSGGAASIDDLTALISAVEKRSICIGDFNLPEINWEDGHARGRAANLLEAAENGLMEQLVTFTTHTRGKPAEPPPHQHSREGGGCAGGRQAGP